NHLSLRWRTRTRIQDWARIVHARHHHVGSISGRIRRVDLPGRVHQTIEDTPLVGVHPGSLDPVVILNGYRRVWHSKLLAEGGRGGIKLGREVIRNEPGEVRGGRCLGPDEEV